MLSQILTGVVLMIAVLLIVALFTKKEYTVEREVTINKPKEEVFNYIKFQKNQDNYNKWVMVDPKAQKGYSGTDGTVGFIYAWDSKNKSLGKGEQEIKKITKGEGVNLEIRFKKPFEGVGITTMRTESVSGNKTKVKWGMAGKNPYPFNLMNLFMDNMLGKDLEISLITLKNVIEKRQSETN